MRYILSIFLLSGVSFVANSSERNNNSQKTIHRLSIETRPAYVVPNHDFFKGENAAGKPIDKCLPFYLKYSFQYSENSRIYQIYRGVYQGIGLGRFDFGNKEEIGNPVALYLFQGATISRLSPRVSFNYEWNFGLSFDWKPYSYDNSYNKVVGSHVNAYIDLNFYIKWVLSRHIDLTTGIDMAHFSNGNTSFPNAGVNTVGFKAGLTYNFNRKESHIPLFGDRSDIPEFKRHISYDLVIFGAQRKKGVFVENEPVAVPGRYDVFGFCFTPMYNLNYHFKVGFSLDGFYDGSANVSIGDYIVGTSPDIIIPPLKKQLALGLSARAEYVMPYFTICVGYGFNAIHGGGSLKATYQILALKAHLTRSTFLHIGYRLQNFQAPNFLMIGVGYRFNNKYPVIR